jgi:hypothetical protein
MGQSVRISKDEEYLSQIAADLLKQMTKLEKLRAAVQLAEARRRTSQRRRPSRMQRYVQQGTVARTSEALRPS